MYAEAAEIAELHGGCDLVIASFENTFAGTLFWIVDERRKKTATSAELGDLGVLCVHSCSG
jgi:hypothetical protein